MLISMNTAVAEPGYHNPSPLVWLTCHANKATVAVEGVEMMALVDTGSQISALTEGFCSGFGLSLPLGSLVHLKGTGSVSIPYKGYMEANLTIPGLP